MYNIIIIFHLLSLKVILCRVALKAVQDFCRIGDSLAVNVKLLLATIKIIFVEKMATAIPPAFIRWVKVAKSAAF